jgi:fatty acid desaturase
MLINSEFENHKTYAGVPDISLLVNSQGISYTEFKKDLKSNFFLIFINFFTPLVMIYLAILPMQFISGLYIVLYCIPCSIWVGFWIQAYTLHFHEAAHFNLAPNKRINDLLSNILLTPFTGILIKDYRISHWKHHLNLGNINDTEISYHKPINTKQMLESLFGIYLLKSSIRYFRNFNNIDLNTKNKIHKKNFDKSFILVITIVLMIFTQLGIFLFLYNYSSIFSAIVWVVGFFIISPFFAQIRQCLEHRSVGASPSIDYNTVNHGPVNRIFGNDLFSKYFGAAGFNKHLLHHCDPTISYTRFNELYNFLNDTKLRNFLNQNTTTYLSTFKDLLYK